MLRALPRQPIAPSPESQMHTSNLIDYCGLLPLTEAFAPLLRGPAASLECEVMMGIADTFDSFVRQQCGAGALGQLLALCIDSDEGVNGAMMLKFQRRVGELAGRRVRLSGLASRPELDGVVCDALSFNVKTGRYAVALPGSGEKISVRAERLAASEPAVAAALVLQVLEFIVGPQRAPMASLHSALASGRAMPVHTVRSVVDAYARCCAGLQHPLDQPLALDGLLAGAHGDSHGASVSLRQHCLALRVAASLHVERSFRHVASALPVASALSWRRWQLTVHPEMGGEISPVALLLTPSALASVQLGGYGPDLEAVIRAIPATQLQILDSISFDPTAAVLAALLPPHQPLAAVFENGSSISLVLLDVQTWRLVCKPVPVSGPNVKPQIESSIDEQD